MSSNHVILLAIVVIVSSCVSSFSKIVKNKMLCLFVFFFAFFLYLMLLQKNCTKCIVSFSVQSTNNDQKRKFKFHTFTLFWSDLSSLWCLEESVYILLFFLINKRCVCLFG